jgi:hypothetical protein
MKQALGERKPPRPTAPESSETTPDGFSARNLRNNILRHRIHHVTAILSSFAPLITGYIRDITGSYRPVFRMLFACLSFVCIIFAKPPVHPSLNKIRA